MIDYLIITFLLYFLQFFRKWYVLFGHHILYILNIGSFHMSAVLPSLFRVSTTFCFIVSLLCCIFFKYSPLIFPFQAPDISKTSYSCGRNTLYVVFTVLQQLVKVPYICALRTHTSNSSKLSSKSYHIILIHNTNTIVWDDQGVTSLNFLQTCPPCKQ